MSRAGPAERNANNDEDAEFDQVDETVNGIIYNKVYEAAEMFAGTYVGQYATGKLDRLLKLVEDTAKWSLPQNNQDKNDSNTPLERPLPWVPFIAMILMLRMVRLSLSLAGLFIGNAPLVPSDVVYFIQTRRRKLRAIRIVGMRDIRRKEQARGKTRSGGLVSKLRSLLSVVVCRPGQGREVQKNTSVHQNSIEGGSHSGGSENQVENDNQTKRCQSEGDDVSDQDLTLDQIIDKYGDASDGNDSDFIPSNDALNNEDTSATSASSEEEDEEEDNNDNEHDKELNQSSGDANPEPDATMTNGKRRSTNSSSSTENQSNDNSVVIRENGNEKNSKSYRKPITMPKPLKLEPVPAPIQEIKQEPFDSDEIRSCNPQSQQDPAVLKRSAEQHQHQQQQAVVAQNDNNPPKCDVPKDNEILKSVVHETADVKENGFENPWENDETSEVFLTPATSTEDLFFSPVGSPNVSGSFGFHPTSILKNPNAVHLEKRGPAVVYLDEDITSGADRSFEINDTSRPINTPHHAAKGNNHNNGKYNKNNKLKGKRR